MRTQVLPRLLLAFLLLWAMAGCQVVKTFKTDTENYADGKIKTIRQTVVKKNRDFELHDNWKEETRTTREYFHNGKLKTFWKVVYSNGTDASCYESYYQYEQYDSTGVKRLMLKSRCDCQRKKTVTWNAKGRIIKKEKTVVKRVE